RNAFLGGGYGSSREFSEKTAEEMDLFIKNLLEERYQHVKQTLSDYREAIEIMVKELFDKEVITGERVREIISEYEAANNLESRLIPLEEQAS
ncbi:ATP-dependent zinc metalloprotease FtsH, partial [Helicobacter pylori]